MRNGHDLYERHAPALFRFALTLCRNHADAEDLVADTFVRLWTASGELRQETVRSYLFTILRNLFATRQRRARRESPLQEATELSLPDPGSRPDERAAARELLGRVTSQLGALADHDRRALQLRTNEGFSYAEIGLSLGMSEGAARVRVHRARALLSKALYQHSGDSV
jgi:RNA polymerase sigma-70 factor (ECF subfamily)